MKVVINPYKDYDNNPGIVIRDDNFQLPENRIYTCTDACYWWQDKWTDFFFHTPIEECEKIGEDHYQTPESEGYSGRTFTINVKGYGIVDLRGPWSGGCYCANQYLPELAIEVTIIQKKRFSAIATAITWSAIRKYLPKGFDIIDSNWNNKHWPEVCYEGKLKQDWSKEFINELDQIYRKFMDKRFQ